MRSSGKKSKSTFKTYCHKILGFSALAVLLAWSSTCLLQRDGTVLSIFLKLTRPIKVTGRRKGCYLFPSCDSNSVHELGTSLPNNLEKHDNA